MNLDVKKTAPSPKDKWEAIELLVEAQQRILDALFIMDSLLGNDKGIDSVYRPLHEMRIKNFIKQFEHKLNQKYELTNSRDSNQ